MNHPNHIGQYPKKGIIILFCFLLVFLDFFNTLKRFGLSILVRFRDFFRFFYRSLS